MQLAPLAQGLQTPAAQTRSLPQPMPSASGACVAEQTAAPVAQAIEPAWQTFVGEHARPAWHGTQNQAPLQTRSVPQLVPGGWPAPWSAQTGAPVPQPMLPR